MSRRAANAVAAGRFVVAASGGFAIVAVTLLAAAAQVHRDVSAPAGAALVLLPVALLGLLSSLPETAAVWVRTAAAQHRLRQLMEMEPLVEDPARPVDATTRPTATMDGVSAGWGETPAFADLSLELPPGRRIAVVGPSGSGKSTLAALLVRFLDPSDGHVRHDGVDLRDLRLGEVRRTTVLIDDDPHVFSSSVRENLRLARPGASDDEVETALRTVSLEEWVDSLPDGLDTMVGDGHRGLSGGERTRLGLARAVLSEADVLVLDEPTAQLDSPTAVAVAVNVLNVLGERTLVWVTHDGLVLEEMDAVVDLADHPAVPATPSSR